MTKLVRPSEMRDIQDVDQEDQGKLEADLDGIAAEKVTLEEEDSFVRTLVDPKLPSEEEVKKHNLEGHVNFRNWCGICVKSRGRELDHKSSGDQDKSIPEYSFGYCFPGDEFGFKWTILVGKERSSKVWMATAVPVKGIEGRFGRQMFGVR